MNSKVYKYCAVPECNNTSVKTPNKVFVYVPHDQMVRNKWLNLAQRDPEGTSLKTRLYFCDDHFDLPNDMVNFMEYHVMGSVGRVLVKPGCVPTKFDCQLNRRECTSDNILELGETSSGSSGLHGKVETITKGEHKSADKSIQVYITHKFRSKAIQTESKMVNQMTSPITIKPSLQSVSTSPFKTTNLKTEWRPSISSGKLFTLEEKSDSDTTYVSQKGTSPSTSAKLQSTSDCSEARQDKTKQEKIKILDYTLFKIRKNPRFYIGVPKNCYYLINLIEKDTNICENHILMCLAKIRLNTPFRELADNFSITLSYASKIFTKNVPIIASVMHPFIVKLDKDLIKNNLPMAFRHKFYNVSCIIDCLEIEVQKPSKALNQSLTWSEYKKANTIKYLVSCTPNGLVNYISPGYGGRITDTCLVESCDFINSLQPGMCVLADRGFKHVEQYLRQHGVQLVRPPSVATGTKLTKTEARETKQIASLRIHVERVIRRLREFNMLKPHACVNNSLIKVLDNYHFLRFNKYTKFFD